MKARAEIIDDELLGLGTLVQLGKRARGAATTEELGFIAVNETHALALYRQAALCRGDAKAAGGVVAVSGAPAIERDAPFALWLERVLAALDRVDAGAPGRMVGAADLPKDLGEEWADWLPPRGLWLSLPGRDGAPLGALFLARDPPGQEGEGRLLAELADIYGHAWAALRGGRRRSWRALWRRGYRLKAAVPPMLFGVLWVPGTPFPLAAGQGGPPRAAGGGG